MLHIVLHFIVPVLLARAFYRKRWRAASAVLIATMIVDVDHLLADPIYDAARCSIGFHPWHGAPAILLYLGLFLLPLVRLRAEDDARERSFLRILHLSGLGLLVHMALDAIDCLA